MEDKKKIRLAVVLFVICWCLLAAGSYFYFIYGITYGKIMAKMDGEKIKITNVNCVFLDAEESSLQEVTIYERDYGLSFKNPSRIYGRYEYLFDLEYRGRIYPVDITIFKTDGKKCQNLKIEIAVTERDGIHDAYIRVTNDKKVAFQEFSWIENFPIQMEIGP